MNIFDFYDKERKKSIPKSQFVGQVSIAQFENIKCI